MQEEKLSFKAPKFLVEKYKKEIDEGGEFYFSLAGSEQKVECIEPNKKYIIGIRKKDSENDEMVYVGGLRTSPTDSRRLEPDGFGCFFEDGDKNSICFAKYKDGMVNGDKYYIRNENENEQRGFNLYNAYDKCRPASMFYNEEQIVDYVYGIISDPFDKTNSNPEMDKTFIYKDYFRLGIWEKLFSCCNAKAMKKSKIYETIERYFPDTPNNGTIRIEYLRKVLKRHKIDNFSDTLTDICDINLDTFNNNFLVQG